MIQKPQKENQSAILKLLFGHQQKIEDYEIDSRHETLLRFLLKNRDEEFRSQVWEIVCKYGLDADDPLFLLLIATGNLEVLLKEGPKELGELYQDWSTNLATRLQEYEQVVVKSQQRAIAQAVRNLVLRVQLEKALHHVPSVITAFMLLLIILGLGAGIGAILLQWRLHLVRLDPRGPLQLTAEQAKVLDWATSTQGQYAKQLLAWNPNLYDRSCMQENARLGVTLTESGLSSKKATSGFCTIWVEPPNQRQFVSTY
jgi:hypothetical protein